MTFPGFLHLIENRNYSSVNMSQQLPSFSSCCLFLFLRIIPDVVLHLRHHFSLVLLFLLNQRSRLQCLQTLLAFFPVRFRPRFERRSPESAGGESVPEEFS